MSLRATTGGKLQLGNLFPGRYIYGHGVAKDGLYAFRPFQHATCHGKMSRLPTSQLPEYSLTLFREDPDFRTYRGVRREAPPILVMAPTRQQADSGDVRFLLNAFSVRDHLEANWAVKPLHLFQQLPSPALVATDPGGEYLDRIEWGGQRDPGVILRLAVGMITALDHLHARDLVHKDVTPANVLVDIDAGRAWWTGFWSTSSTAEVRADLDRPPVIGSLAYKAPEQTGRVNRSVDARSDLYAFGVLLYELLSGSLPLQGSTRADWEHTHVARAPMPLRERTPHVPPPLAAITMALLSKDPADRYQTATAVRADLEHCLAAWERSRSTHPLVLAREDMRFRLMDLPLPASARPLPHAEVDLLSVVRALQTVSRELVLDRLVDTLMESALLSSGADRGFLVKNTETSLSIEAEAYLRDGEVRVEKRRIATAEHTLPASILNYVRHTLRPVIVNDTSTMDTFNLQRSGAPRALLCLPLVTQGRLSGILWVEHSLTTNVFTSARVIVLELLSAQAAISLENARLYHALQRENLERTKAESLLAAEKTLLEMVVRGSSLSSIMETICHVVEASLDGMLCAMMLYDSAKKRLELVAAPSLPLGFVDGHRMAKSTGLGTFGPCGAALVAEAPTAVTDIASEERWPVFRELALTHGIRACWSWPIGTRENPLGTFALYASEPGVPLASHHRLVDQVTHIARIAIERVAAEDALHKLRSDLAHVARVTTLGELTASIAHEINQPLTGIRLSASACIRWLDHEPAELELAKDACLRVVRDAGRAGDTVNRLRKLFRKTPVSLESLDWNELIQEVVHLVQPEARRQGASLRAVRLQTSPRLLGDRVQIQQVLVNLILNGIEAMATVTGRAKQVTIECGEADVDGVQVTVTDTGIGADPRVLDQLFDSFVTTKPSGLGMGLSISRTIVEAHGGKIWAEAGLPHGMVFRFTLPCSDEADSRQSDSMSVNQKL